MLTREVYFFLGTHFKYKTWLILGVFYPEKELIDPLSKKDVEDIKFILETTKKGFEDARKLIRE